MSVCDPVDGMHAAFPALIPEQVFLPRPPAATLVGGALVADDAAVHAWVAVLEQTVERHGDELAAVIVEPVLQGAGGMFVLRPSLPARAASRRRRDRPVARLRRDRDRLRAHRQVVRGRVGRRRGGRHVRRQGAHRRLPQPRGGALQRGVTTQSPLRTPSSLKEP